MFKVTAEDQVGDWTIYHNTEIKMEPKKYIHLDEKVLLIGGTGYFAK